MCLLAPAAFPPTPEWIKILVTALLSFITGIVLEPLRGNISRRLTARRALKVLYFELARIYEFSNDAHHLSPEMLRVAAPRIILEHFDYYYSEHREAYYLIPQHASLSGLFREIKLSLADAATKGGDPHRSFKDIVEAINARIIGGVVDRRKFDHAMRTMQQTSQPVREVLRENLLKAFAESRHSER